MSALKFQCRMNSQDSAALSTPRVRAALKGIRNLEADRSTARPGCTVKLLKGMCKRAKIVYSDFEASLVSAVFRMAFFGFLRVSEYASTPANHQLMVNDCSVINKTLAIRIPSSKSSKKPIAIILRSQLDKEACPVLAYTKYMRMRPACASRQLFVGSDGEPLTSAHVSQYLKALSPGDGSLALTSHSFRIGGATWAAQSGWSDADIRAHGRWSSEAFLSYIRPSLMGGYSQANVGGAHDS